MGGFLLSPVASLFLKTGRSAFAQHPAVLPSFKAFKYTYQYTLYAYLVSSSLDPKVLGRERFISQHPNTA